MLESKFRTTSFFDNRMLNTNRLWPNILIRIRNFTSICFSWLYTRDGPNVGFCRMDAKSITLCRFHREGITSEDKGSEILSGKLIVHMTNSRTWLKMLNCMETEKMFSIFGRQSFTFSPAKLSIFNQSCFWKQFCNSHLIG